jgi:hypothetical protein
MGDGLILYRLSHGGGDSESHVDHLRDGSSEDDDDQSAIKKFKLLTELSRANSGESACGSTL